MVRGNRVDSTEEKNNAEAQRARSYAEKRNELTAEGTEDTEKKRENKGTLR